VHPTERRRLVSSLSGGNQQKIAFGKWLPSNPRVFIMDEPTRGVDVGAKAEIHNLVRMLADQGVAVLFVSSDLPELLSLADRILVVRDGRIVRELTGNEATDTTVMAAAVGHDEKVGSNV
jgi:rhamnose transport system ATP-binding protein